ncbi:hypothetical protein BgiBS90_030755, partial [Biomphalaria glabrata]
MKRKAQSSCPGRVSRFNHCKNPGNQYRRRVLSFAVKGRQGSSVRSLKTLATSVLSLVVPGTCLRRSVERPESVVA